MTTQRMYDFMDDEVNELMKIINVDEEKYRESLSRTNGPGCAPITEHAHAASDFQDFVWRMAAGHYRSAAVSCRPGRWASSAMEREIIREARVLVSALRPFREHFKDRGLEVPR